MFELTEFKLDENEETFLSIKGKVKGIFALILSWVGLDQILELKCSKTEFLHKSSTLRKGQVNLNIPVSAVTSIMTGFQKPLSCLVAAVLAVIFGIYLYSSSDGVYWIFIGLIVAAIFIFVYKISKTMILGIYNGGGNHNCIEIKMKKGVVNGIKIDFDTFEKVAALLNKTVDELYANKRTEQ